MKHVVSVSLGSSRRDHKVETEILGEKFFIERIGTDGDFTKAVELIRSLDGKIDAFGMGGIDLFIVAGDRRYMLRDALRLKAAAQKTPMVDGSGLKNTLERRTIQYLAQEGIIDFIGKKVLLVCGVDRFGMAEALLAAGADVTFGDLIFGLNLPIPLKSWEMLSRVVKTIGPLVSKIPFKYLYPTGEQQDVIIAKFGKYYDSNEIIAGDFHFIKKYLPANLQGKGILTNTIISEDIKLLAQRGAHRLITTTPELGGRSFGTNVMEAVLVVLLQKKVEEITPDDYNHILDLVKYKPRVENLLKIATA